MEKKEIEVRAYELGTIEMRKEFMDILMDVEYIESLGLRKSVTRVLRDFTTFVKFGHPYEIAKMNLDDFLKEIIKMLNM